MSEPSPRLVVGGMAATAGLVAVTTLLSRLVGLGRWAVFSDSVGATCLGQVYATANQVPNVLYEVAVGGASAAVAVPLVSGLLLRGREDAADRTASALLTWTLCLLVPLSVGVAAASGPLARLLLGSATGCDAAGARAAGGTMLLLFAPQIALYGLGIVLTGVLQAHRRFFAAAVAPLASSVVVIATYVAFGLAYDPTGPVAQVPRSGVLLLAGGTTLGVAALSLPLLLPARRAGVRWRPTLRFPAGVARRAGGLAGAGVLAVTAQQLTVLATVLGSNRVGVGVLNVYTYAQTAYLLPYAVLVVPLATVAFPRLSGGPAAVDVLRRTTRAVLVGGLLGLLGLVAVRREVGTVFLALDAGTQGPGRAALLALPATLACFAPGLVGLGLAAVLTRALYAVGPPTRAALSVAIGWGVAALGPLLLIAVAPGVQASLVLLGVTSSLGMSISALLLWQQVRVSWGVDPLRGAGRSTTWVLAAGCAVLAARELLAVFGVAGTGAQGWVAAVLTAVVTAAVLTGAVLAALRISGDTAYRAVLGALTPRREAH